MLRLVLDAWRKVRVHGLSAVIAFAIETYVFASRQWVIFRADLAGPPADPGSDGIVFRPYRPEDAHLLAAFEPYRRATELRNRVAEGFWLDLALDGERPVAFRWARITGPKYGPLARLIHLEPGQIWPNVFCMPEYRGRGIAKRLGLLMNRRLGALGYREEVSAIRLDNAASIRSTLDQGDEPVRIISYFRLLWWARYRISTDLSPVYEVAGRRGGTRP